MVSLAIWVISTCPGNAFARPNFHSMETRDSCGLTHLGLNKQPKYGANWCSSNSMIGKVDLTRPLRRVWRRAHDAACCDARPRIGTPRSRDSCFYAALLDAQVELDVYRHYARQALVVLVGQRRSLSMAVKGKQAQRQWSKPAEWLRY